MLPTIYSYKFWAADVNSLRTPSLYFKRIPPSFITSLTKWNSCSLNWLLNALTSLLFLIPHMLAISPFWTHIPLTIELAKQVMGARAHLCFAFVGIQLWGLWASMKFISREKAHHPASLKLVALLPPPGLPF